MRNTKILAALAALVGTIPAFGFTGLSPRAEASQTIDLAKAIDTLQSSARVTAQATLTTDYGTGFEGLNTTEDYSIDRIYGTIAGEDGSATRAVRDLAAANPITYYEGENHNVWTDYLLPNNTVASREVLILNMPQAFSRLYANPWDFITERDIADDATLAPQKASLLLTDYLGVDFAVSEAAITFSGEGLIQDIDFTCPEKPGQVSVGFSGTFDIVQTLDVTMTFAYDSAPLTHLTPATDTNEDLAEALTSIGSNYTVMFNSTYLAKPVRYYVVGNMGALLHFDAAAKRLVEGDIFLNGDFTQADPILTPYVYQDGVWAQQGTAQLEDYFPALSQLSAAVFDQVGTTGTYALKGVATTYCGDYLNPSASLTGVTPNTSVVGSVTIADGHVVSTATAQELGSSVTASYADYGTTEFPAWFSTEDLIENMR